MERGHIFGFISHDDLPCPAFATGTVKLHHLFWSRSTALVAVVPLVAAVVEEAAA